MSRLTRKKTIIIRENEIAACNYENDECNDSCRYGICKWQEKANMRLKQYEDTGLSPEQVQQLKERDTAKIPHIEGDGCDNNGNIIYDTWICPNCKEYYEVEYDDYDFCPKCGQKIDLSELNN